jgi:FlaA1/EpsC-like NDP-sugar epimerase
MFDQWPSKRVMITGVCGTVGRELLRQLLAAGVTQVVGVDNDESALFFLDDEHRALPDVRFHLGDIRDRESLAHWMRDVDVVLHTAAFKHVMLCEHSPSSAIATNVLGVQNVIDAAIESRVERVLFTSSDKAVNPTNVMGTSKLMGERLITAANSIQRNGGTIFASTRFGNVLGSRGSVIPIFRQQIAAGGPVTLTDSAMTRFIMTLSEAVELVTESTFMAVGGEVFVTKMPVLRIEDLARVMIEELAPRHDLDPARVEVEVIGTKPGEKMYEELMNDEEIRRSLELDRYFVVKPAFDVSAGADYVYEGMVAEGKSRPYNSAQEVPLSRSELRDYLRKSRLLEEEEAAGAYPGSGG